MYAKYFLELNFDKYLIWIEILIFTNCSALSIIRDSIRNERLYW